MVINIVNKKANKTVITVIIPAKDEEVGIEEIVRKAMNYCQEVIVIDGHSKDKTILNAKKAGAKIFLDHNKGKGEAIRLGIKKASGDILVFMDADGSHDCNDISKLVEPILKNKADLVIGSRIKGGSDEFYAQFDSFIRQIGSDIIALTINFRYKTELTDVENGFRAIKRDVAKKLSLKANDFDIEQEMIIKAAKNGYRITEVATHEYARKWGKSKLPTSRGWLFIWSLFKEIF